jgi:elongation factor Ts
MMISPTVLTEENPPKFNLKKVLEDIVLMDQEFTFGGSSRTVAEVLEEQSNKLGSKIAIKNFMRYESGEGVEKVADTFASDIQKLVNN